MFRLNDFFISLFHVVAAFWAPAFYLYSCNVGEAPISDFLFLITGLFFAALFLLLFFRKFMDSYFKVSLLLSFFYFGIYFFINIYRYIYVLDTGLSSLSFLNKKYYFLLYFIIFTVLFFYISFIKKVSRNLIKFLFVVYLYLIIFYFGKSFFINLNIKREVSKYVFLNNKFREENNKQFDLLKVKQKRDIYYIILDAHASSKVLREYHGYDNSWFVQSLKKRGFYLSENSLSNYFYTVLSIPSSLNMQYHFKKFDHNNLTFGLAYHMLKDNNATFFLKKLGYKNINVSFAWGPTSKMNNKPLVRSFFCGEFTQEFFYQLFSRFFLNWFYNYMKRKDHFDQLYSLKEYIKTDGPKFVFSHFLCPHRPFVFKRDGSLRLSYNISNLAYIEQLYYFDKQVIKIIDFILDKSELKPIIILQADHGSHGNLFVPRIRSKFIEKDIKMLQHSMFSAYYLPDFDESKLYDSISPVNNFRVIFNNYFCTNFDILEDKINFYG